MVCFLKQFLSINQNEIVSSHFSDFIASNIETLTHSFVARLDLQIVKWHVFEHTGLVKIPFYNEMRELRLSVFKIAYDHLVG